MFRCVKPAASNASVMCLSSADAPAIADVNLTAARM
jgi:hypothetical protein